MASSRPPAFIERVTRVRVVFRGAGVQFVSLEVGWAPRRVADSGLAPWRGRPHPARSGGRTKQRLTARGRRLLQRDLVLRAQRGEEAAFAALALEVGDRLHATAQHILRDSDLAEDAVQQAMIEMWRKLPQLRDPDKFVAWTYRIVVRAAHAEIGRRARWRVGGGQLEHLPDPSADATAHVDDRDQLERAFGRLALDHRTVVVLKHYAGLSNGEIATVLAVPEGTVRSRLFHAMQALRAIVEADQRAASGAAGAVG